MTADQLQQEIVGFLDRALSSVLVRGEARKVVRVLKAERMRQTDQQKADSLAVYDSLPAESEPPEPA